MTAPRVAVVSGGASGIGLGVARRLAADGHAVALLDRDVAVLHLASDSVPGSLAVEVDVSDWDGVAFEVVCAALAPVSVLVTSAGVDAFEPLGDITRASWERVIGINLTGTFACIQAAVPDMVGGGWAPIPRSRPSPPTYPWVEPARRRTSPPPARTCAPTRGATSPAR